MLKLLVPFVAAACLTSLASPAAAKSVEAAQARPSLMSVSLHVADLEKQLAFYTHGFGMAVADRLEGPKATEIILTWSGNNASGGIMLIKSKEPEQARQMGNGYSRTIINVPDIAGFAARLKKAGYALDMEPVSVPGYPVKVAMASDPEGYKYELVEWLDGRASK